MPKSPRLRRPSAAVVHACAVVMQEHTGAATPPLVTGKVIAVVCQLGGAPFPPRQELANRLRCSRFSIDKAVYNAIDLGLVHVTWDSHSVRRITPTPLLLDGLAGQGVSMQRPFVAELRGRPDLIGLTVP